MDLAEWANPIILEEVKKTPTDRNRSFLSYTGMALQMMVTILLGTFIGRWIDQRTQTKFPIGTLAGVFAGMGIAFYRVFKSLK